MISNRALIGSVAFLVALDGDISVSLDSDLRWRGASLSIYREDGIAGVAVNVHCLRVPSERRASGARC